MAKKTKSTSATKRAMRGDMAKQRPSAIKPSQGAKRARYSGMGRKSTGRR